MAFAPLFEEAGVAGAGSIALATAMGGIVLGSIVGAPLATLLVVRNRLRAGGGESLSKQAVAVPAEQEGDRVYAALKSLTFVLLAMWLGSGISQLIEDAGVTLPAYVGALIVGGFFVDFSNALIITLSVNLLR
jgi:ESS family glutamate:Na+ symporter